jgi:acetylornithine deacetylase/succinyl-diaminopimelate desuccinylase-like protein
MRARTTAAALAALLLATGGQAASSKPSPVPPAGDQQLAHDILKELIAINTVHEHGTLPAARAIQARLKAAGFADADVSLLTIPEHPSQGQLVVRLRAKAPKAKPVLWIGHLDVVEAKPEDWTVDPFVMTEKDGWWYGRGVQDMKSEDAAILAGLIRLKREGFVPDRDLILAFTSDEESGDANGVDWLLKTHRDLIDAALVINPDAGGGSLSHGQRLAYGVQTSEKVYVTFQAMATDKGGHSSIPEPNNPIYRLAEALGRVSAYHFPVAMTDTTRAWFTANADRSTGQQAADMRAVSRPAGDLAAAERLSATPHLAARLRTTCVATELAGGHAENALPQRATASIQCRMIPTDSEAGVKALLEKAISDPKVTLTPISPSQPAPDIPVDPALFAAFQKVVDAEWPGVKITPHMDLGASDSIFTRAVGIPSYGLSAIWSDLDDNRAHGRDERIGQADFYQGVEFAYRLMRELGKGRD